MCRCWHSAVSDRSYFSRQVVLSPDSGLGQIPSRVVVNPNNASLDTVRQTLGDYDADIVYMYTRFRNETIRSGLPYVKRYYRHPMFEMIYRYNNGQERIDLNMVPVPGGVQPRLPVEDINPDGVLSFGMAYGGGQGLYETGDARRGPTNYNNSASEIELHNTWWIYTIYNSIAPYIFYGTAAQAYDEAAQYTTINAFGFQIIIGRYKQAYRLQQYFQWNFLARANDDLREEAQVWGWPDEDYTQPLSLFTVQILKGSLYQRDEFQLTPTLGGVAPEPILPEGFTPGGPSYFNPYQRQLVQGPTTATVTLRDGNTKRRIAEFDMTVSQSATNANGVIKLGPTALRAKNEYTNPETSRGAEVEIAPPPPRPFSDMPYYFDFEHSDDPTTYVLAPGLNLITEIPRDQLPAGGAYEIVLSMPPPDRGYASVYISGEFFAQNIIREVTSSWTKKATTAGEVIRTNDFPVMPMPETPTRTGTSYDWGVYSYTLNPGSDIQYPSSYVVSFRLDQLVLPAEDDPTFTLWGYVDLFMTVTPQ